MKLSYVWNINNKNRQYCILFDGRSVTNRIGLGYYYLRRHFGMSVINKKYCTVTAAAAAAV